MIIQESQRYYNNIQTDPFNLLESMNYLDENIDMDPQLVPVVENAQLGALLISLEDLANLRDNSSMTCLGEAVESVCYSNNIYPEYINFTINDYSLLESSYYAYLVNNLLEEGIPVYIKPFNMESSESLLLEAAFLDGVIFDNWDFLNEITGIVAVDNYTLPVQGTDADDAADSFFHSLKQAKQNGLSISAQP